MRAPHHREARVDTLVPFHQIAIDFSTLAEAGQLAGLARAFEGLVRTRAKVSLANIGANSVATFRQFSVSGISVIPVCSRLNSIPSRHAGRDTPADQALLESVCRPEKWIVIGSPLV
jgi:hypothetical protein